MNSLQPALTRSVTLAAVLVLALGSSGCGGANGQEDAGEKAERPIPVEVVQVVAGTMVAAYEGTTTLEAEQEADIVAKTGGVILELLLEEGDEVRAGQVVARLDRERLALQQRQARAQLRKLESEFARLEELSERKLVSRDQFDKLRFDLEQQRAAVALAELELGYTDVRSPIDGVITERLVKVGNLVELYAPLYRVDDFDPLLAVMHVPERELPTLAVGQPARIAPDATPGRVFDGTLARVSPVVDPDTGTFKVTVEVADPDPALKPGMFGRVRIVHDVHEDTATLPRAALLVEDRSRYVFRVDDGVARKILVQTGYVDAERIEILSGVTLGERVVTSGKSSIADGSAIEVIESETESRVAAGPATATAD